MPNNISDKKVVWITGASSGIGKAMAFEWVRQRVWGPRGIEEQVLGEGREQPAQQQQREGRGVGAAGH